jgi:hypothetical protein
MNLKPYFDAAQAANAEVLDVANKIDAAFSLGTEDGTAQAMEMRQSLDEAQARAEAAGKLYQSMKNAAATGENAAKFVPASVSTETAAQAGKKVISRAEFDQLSYADRYTFFKDGGSVMDVAAE